MGVQIPLSEAHERYVESIKDLVNWFNENGWENHIDVQKEAWEKVILNLTSLGVVLKRYEVIEQTWGKKNE